MEAQDKPKTTMASVEHLLKEVYLDSLNEQLKRDSLFFGGKKFAPYVPTFKDKWHDFWDHIPDFINFLKQYKYNTWQYWDKDGY